MIFLIAIIICAIVMTSREVDECNFGPFGILMGFLVGVLGILIFSGIGFLAPHHIQVETKPLVSSGQGIYLNFQREPRENQFDYLFTYSDSEKDILAKITEGDVYVFFDEEPRVTVQKTVFTHKSSWLWALPFFYEGKKTILHVPPDGIIYNMN